MDSFIRHLDECSRKVAEWPQWKREILGTMDSPCLKCSPWPDCTDRCRLLAEWKNGKGRAKAYPIIAEILDELDRAESLHAPGTTKAHYYGVLREEFREYEDEVFREKSECLNDAIRREAVQLGAMVVRMLKDLGGSK